METNGTRVDSAHPAALPPLRRQPHEALRPAFAHAAPGSAATAPHAEPAPEPETLLHGHARELISRLQSWADQLDQREAELNARQAVVERQERQRRLSEQQHQMEQSSQLKQLEQQRRELNQKLAAAALALGAIRPD